MSEFSPPATRQHGGALRWVRYGYRVPLLALHVFLSLPFLLACMALSPGRACTESFGDRVVCWWSTRLLGIFGLRVRRIGTPLPNPALFVANHVSWIDIVMLHSQRMMGFVAKREIAGWPLVGWLATRGQTIYHQRGSTASLGGVLQAMLERLRSGRSVGVFPEGRTRGGHDVGPFHARIFQAAVQAEVAVQPVALRYGAGGAAQTVVAFAPHENFFANFLRLLGEPGRVAEVHFLEPIRLQDVDGRRRIAETARARIIAAMAQR
ncbi:lysophospholipid acyltransferase family protein [Xanthomonas theicola]|uniref:1-acyl-sn-glycerol-3-phosphate acyltransferase n=1 Tax=Xanthomonas theicola TaxID=56464 RepID=A0A2S6Z7Q2_9XANT|nr:lysophospholipid acyltransferase family protein [Xanthomonas theicola]PPT77786.1 1-acyl-sn-glycerol-3-phosphate acyltransferase [Xanthomonas theicola]QNH26502.1 1-acyl-sn-glycerol-3-phosphate acyltransferase [Xanthomonas theicola]